MTILELLTDPAKKVVLKNNETDKQMWWNGSRWCVCFDDITFHVHLSLDAAISDFERQN